MPLNPDFPQRKDLEKSLAEAADHSHACKTAEEKKIALWDMFWITLKTALLPQVLGSQMATELSALRLGDCAAVFLPGECLLAIDRAIRPRTGLSHYMTSAYADLSMGYICTREVFEEGGYEPSESFLGPGAADILINEATDLLNSLST